MGKSIAIIIIIFILIFGGAYLENKFITDTFDSLEEKLVQIYDSFENNTSSHIQIELVYSWWNDQKHCLHSVIPHSHISTLDAYFFDAIELKRHNLDNLAQSKIKILIGLAEAIPHSFALSLENIF